MPRARLITLFLVLVLWATGCAHADLGGGVALDATLDAEARRAATTLGRDDVFEVRVYAQPGLSASYRVPSEGAIVFPLIGEVKVADKTTSEVESEIAERLEAGFLQHAYVSVFIKEFNSKKVFVFGQVQRPGTFPFTEGLTFIQAITLAGGPTANAAKGRVSITRRLNGRDSRMSVNVDEIMKGNKANPRLLPGDIVFVPEAIF